MRYKKGILLFMVGLIMMLGTGCAPSSTETVTDSVRPMATAHLWAEQGAFDVMAISVGKADAILLRADDRVHLIDTGSKSSVPRLFAALHATGITALDGVWLTHTHNDHIGGMDRLAQYYDIETLYCAEITTLTDKGVNKFERLSQDHDIPLRKLRAGERVALSDHVYADVLGPLSFNAADDNDNSLVLRVSAYGRTVLLTGDMQFAEEENLLQAGVECAADVLKVGNHGNRDATSPQFADAVSPEVAIISTDTREDTNSAHSRVRSALSDARIYVTEDFSLGVWVQIAANGGITVSNPTVSAAPTRLSIASIHLDTQTLTLRNEGDTLDISDYMIASEKGNELFVFPKGTVIQSGATLTVSGEGGVGDYQWPGEDRPWNLKNPDPAVLYDRYGHELHRIVA